MFTHAGVSHAQVTFPHACHRSLNASILSLLEKSFLCVIFPHAGGVVVILCLTYRSHIWCSWVPPAYYRKQIETCCYQLKKVSIPSICDKTLRGEFCWITHWKRELVWTFTHLKKAKSSDLFIRYFKFIAKAVIRQKHLHTQHLFKLGRKETKSRN